MFPSSEKGNSLFNKGRKKSNVGLAKICSKQEEIFYLSHNFDYSHSSSIHK